MEPKIRPEVRHRLGKVAGLVPELELFIVLQRQELELFVEGKAVHLVPLRGSQLQIWETIDGHMMLLEQGAQIVDGLEELPHGVE